MDQILDIAHAKFGLGMGQEIGRDISHPDFRFLVHLVQHDQHILRVALLVMHQIKTDPVRLLFVLPGKGKAHGGAGSHAARHQGLGKRTAAKGDPGQHHGQGAGRDLGGVFNPFGNMPADDMAAFMGHDTDQFPFRVHGVDDPGMKKNQTGRGSKCIEFLIINDIEMIVKKLRPGLGQNRIAEFIDILADIKLIHQLEFPPDNGEHILPVFPLLLDRESGHNSRRTEGETVNCQKEEQNRQGNKTFQADKWTQTEYWQWKRPSWGKNYARHGEKLIIDK